MNEQEAQGWGAGGVGASASRLQGLAMGHDPSRTALSPGLQLCSEGLGRLT